MMRDFSYTRILHELQERGGELRYHLSCSTISTFRGLRATMRGQKRKTILFYPEKPKYLHSAYVVCYMLGYRITRNPKRKAEAVIRFEDVTKSSSGETLRALAERMPVINLQCDDISKIKVEKEFQEVFGYGMAVDPETYTGVCVQKSDENAKHDGKVISCPMRPESGYIYQKLIDNTVGGEAVDIRVIIFKERIPFVVLRYKNLDDRFNLTTHIAIKDPEEILSADEIEKIHAFCRRMGMDYGELDILRDNQDGRIYIVDANKTPSGPRISPEISREVCNDFYSRLCAAFEDMVASSDASVLGR